MFKSLKRSGEWIWWEVANGHQKWAWRLLLASIFLLGKIL